MYAGYTTNLGSCVCADSLDYLQTLPAGSIDLVMTSPPFALQRKKSYGNADQSEYVDWLSQFGALVFDKLAESGSFVLDLGGAYEKGVPSFSLYQFRVLLKLCDDIGFKLAQPFYWFNPSALPAPIEYVNKKKIRAKNAVNTVWWLCKSPKCKADVRQVLAPYSDRMKKLIKNPTDFVKAENTPRPSGHVMGLTTWRDNGGAIPPNLLQIPNSESNSQYLRYCKAIGVKGHPARFPAGLPEFFIKFLTDPGDLVVDIFGGSNTTGAVADSLNRRWLSVELSREYVAASACRFAENAEHAQLLYNAINNGEHVELKTRTE